MWPNFNLIKEACIRRIWDNLKHQRFAVLMGNDVVEAIGASVPKKYTRHIIYVNLRVNFLGSPQPFFWILKDSGTHKIELVLFCCWHLATFQPRYKKSMELKMCADFLWNAICEFSGVPVADPTFFQDRGRPHNRHSSSSASSFSVRRQTFRTATAVEQDAILQSFKSSGETAEDFFGGWTVEQVLSSQSPNEMDFSSNHPGTQAIHRNAFRKHPTTKHQKILRSIQNAGKTPEDYFGEGYSINEVLNGGK